MKKICGIALIALGVAGFILPFFPGWIFMLAGLTLLKRKDHNHVFQ